MKAPIDNFSLEDYPVGSVTQFFGENKALYAAWGLKGGHNGIDVVAPHGSPLYAVEDGIVISVNNDPSGFGRHLRILCDDREWTYGHCDTITVKVGDVVKEGQQIATMGNTGFVVTTQTAATWWGSAPSNAGTHLHLGLRIAKRNPKGWSYPGSNIKITIQNYDNGMKGAIDPVPFLSIPFLQRMVLKLQALIKKKNV